VSQGKSNHNICGVRLYCGSEVFLEYRLDKIGPSRNGNHGKFTSFGPNPGTPLRYRSHGQF